MYRQNKLVAVATFLFFAWLTYTGWEFDEMASYMPVTVGVLGMALCLCLFATVCFKEKMGVVVLFAKAFPKKETLQLILAFALVSAYCLLMPYVGFIVSSTAFFFLFSLCFGKKEKIVLYLVYSALTVAVIYFSFTLTLHTSFPKGFMI